MDMPPIRFTGNTDLDWILLVFAAVVCLYWLRALRLAREGARLLLLNLVKAFLAFGATMFFLTSLRTILTLGQRQIISGVVALVCFNHFQSRKRSRHIPKAVKRAVIARDLSDGEYDPSKYHIDHVWPFARGGSHTADNLRVIERQRNLKKGAKRPRLREMW